MGGNGWDSGTFEEVKIGYPWWLPHNSNGRLG